MQVGDVSPSIFSLSDFNSPMFDSGRNNARADDVLTGHQPELRPPTSPYQPTNGTSMSDVSGYGYSGKVSLGAYRPNRSPPIAGSPSGLTHVNPAATRNVDQRLSPPEKMEEVDQGYWLPGYTPLLTNRATHYHQRHGQITPPDELSPESVCPSGLFLQEDLVMEQLSTEQRNDIDRGRDSGTKRRTKAASRSDSGRPTTYKRLREGSKMNNQAESQDSEGRAKREKFLERNRMAASKCRQKKKEWENNLETRARELTAEKAHLSAHVASLKAELLYLMGECLKHTGCNCTKIREYLMVAMMSPASSALYDHPNNMLVDLKLSKLFNNDFDGSGSEPHSRQGSMGADFALTLVETDEDMRSLLSASIR